MTTLQEFNEKFKEYESNSATQELKNLINLVLDKDPEIILYKGKYYEQYEYVDDEKKYFFKVNPDNDEFEVVEKFGYYYATYIKRTFYYIGLYDDMYVKKESVENTIINDKFNSQLLLKASKTEERFTKTGFQKCKVAEEINSEHFIYISNEMISQYELFVPSNFSCYPNEAVLTYINFNPINKEYWLSSLNYSIQASEEDTHNLVVFYNENGNTICFPAFFDNDKNIYLNEFILNDYLQFYALDHSGIKDEEILFEGHTIKDAAAFYLKRKSHNDFIKTIENYKKLKKSLN